jgi:hypothetical protein
MGGIMYGQAFPVSDYYKGHILDAVTISRVGGWWTAVLLIEEPNTKSPFIGIYRWQLTENGWKMRKTISIKRKKEFDALFASACRFAERLS